jgi:(heptosyl)LPS beta-1,4-glucosyltransferase
VILIALMMPDPIQQRLLSGFDPSDTTTRGRLDIWRSGIFVVLDNPLTGVGYSSVAVESLKYRRESDLPEWAYQHSHNNLIQVAATSGIPAVIAWIALWLKIIWDFFRIRHRCGKDEFVSVQAAAGISILVAFHLMGMLEYNFGDSEVLTLLLFFISVPYVLSRTSAPRDSE